MSPPYEWPTRWHRWIPISSRRERTSRASPRIVYGRGWTGLLPAPLSIDDDEAAGFCQSGGSHLSAPCPLAVAKITVNHHNGGEVGAPSPKSR